jgi:hypothetical protein
VELGSWLMKGHLTKEKNKIQYIETVYYCQTRHGPQLKSALIGFEDFSPDQWREWHATAKLKSMSKALFFFPWKLG